MIEIYTDGACSGNPGMGGWAAIVLEKGSERTLRGRQEKTTNNRMELLAVIKGLETVPSSSDVTIYSDSQYVVNTMTQNWKRHANKDLWAKLDAEVNKRTVTWEWIRGHAGNPLNEKADKLATHEAKNKTAGKSASESLTHVDASGISHMVDIGPKLESQRTAIAKGSVLMHKETLELIRNNGLKKGDVLGIARVAGIMGAKGTSQLIPLCHPLSLDQIAVEFQLNDQRDSVDITSTAKITAKTGVEMEALTAVCIAALTIYDMCKSVDREMRIEGIRLVRKSGGRSGDIVLEE